MNLILFDDEEWSGLRPLTLTKPLSELRMGILTFRERWEKLLGVSATWLTKDYLSEKYPTQVQSINLFINPAFFPNAALIRAIQALEDGELLVKNEKILAAKLSMEDFKYASYRGAKKDYDEAVIRISRLWDLFLYNGFAIKFDFDLMTAGRTSQPISPTNGVIDVNNVFLEEGAKVEYAILNAKEGPIYIGKDAEIMEGSMIRGGLALCEHGKINMGAKIYPGTTIGPHSKVGGEVNNVIFTGYSNKGHDGFLGNSVIGEWCNLGADTNNSNLKNNYSEVRVWDYEKEDYINTGLQFCGLFMGDYSKSAIDSRFNTGTVIGVSANVFDSGFPPKFIPSFSWGGSKESSRFDLDKSYESAQRMMKRREKILTEKDKHILKYIFNN